MTSTSTSLSSSSNSVFNSSTLSTPTYVAHDIQPYINEENVEHKNYNLVDIIKEKNLEVLMNQYGGVHGVVCALQTDIDNGVCGDLDISHRRGAFGSNTYLKPPRKGFLHFVLEALKDTVIVILLVRAALSLGFGIKENGVKEGWYDGGSILLLVVLVVGVSAVSNFKRSRQFIKLSSVTNNMQVDVVRDGRQQNVSIFDIVVGDVVCLKIGDQIPADGLFINGHSLQVDESSMTGETEPVDIDSERNPFLLSGCKVADGYGTMIVTSVGMNTAWGEMMSSVSFDSTNNTPLQDRLSQLNSYMGRIGLGVAFLVFVLLSIRYFAGKTRYENRGFNGSKTNFNDVMNSMLLIFADTVALVAIVSPKGLPLAVTVTIAYSMKRMIADQIMVRNPTVCETMGTVTAICTDKTGTLTLSQMKVTKFFIGQESMKGEEASRVSSNVLELLYQGVGLNTTGSVIVPKSGAPPEFSGSPTEKAILSWAVLELGMNVEELKQRYNIDYVEAFNSNKKRSGMSIRRKNDKTIHVHWKGAAEMILAMCSSFYERTGDTKSMNEAERMNLEQIIKDMAAESLRCIAFAHGQFRDEQLEYKDGDNTRQKPREEGLTLLGLIGLKDPCRPGVRNAVQACLGAGVKVIMITGDNVFTAKAIAMECGILCSSQDLGAVVEGVEFRNYTNKQRMELVERIRVLARSSPLDKLLMVRYLKQKGHVVAVTGDGKNDAQALKEADVGISMGIQGTEEAKGCSHVVMLDDNFDSVVTVLRWGRCVFDSIQKFLQFQLTLNLAALVINFIVAVSAGEVPLTTFQLLWVNLLMDTLGALALATDRPAEELLETVPVYRRGPLITSVMWMNVVSQALYQITVLLILQFKGKTIFGVNEKVKDTLIFNTFVLCQVFNEFNARKMVKRNVFRGVHKNKVFLGVVGITIVLQAVMVEFLNKFADVERLSWKQWGACICIASVSWPIGWFVKCIHSLMYQFSIFS